jgi:hypothetical protein
VPPQHLMSPVHSADGRRPGHPAGGIPVHSVGRQYAHAAALIMTRALPRMQPRHINTVCTTDIMALGDRPGVSYFLPFCPWAHMSGLSILVCAPLSYKREGTLRYKARSLRSNLDAQSHLDTQTHKFIQALKLNKAHSGVGYYAPAARTTLNPSVFLCSSRIHLAGKTLRPLLILGFRAGAFRHLAGEFPL